MPLTVRDVMTEDVAAVPPGATLLEVARLMDERRVSGLPVVDGGGRVLGVVSEADLLLKGRWLVDRLDIGQRLMFEIRVAREAMSAPAVTIGPASSLATAGRRMLAHDVNRLPVVEAGELVGIITRSDLVRGFSRGEVALAEAVLHQR